MRLLITIRVFSHVFAVYVGIKNQRYICDILTKIKVMKEFLASLNKTFVLFC